MEFTIKELCDFLEAEVPNQLKKVENDIVKAVNARYTTLEDGDVFFDINNDCEDLSIINAKRCPFIISDRELNDFMLDIPVVKIDNALERYVNLCKAFVDEYPETIRIAVTGSTGKTSMKETIAGILGNIASTDKTFSNQNNIYFLSKRLHKVMKNNLRFYVQEACIKVYEGINLTQKLAEAIQPKIVVMTNIFDNHAEVYGSRETTFRIKSSLVEEMGSDGIAFLNMDDDILRAYSPKCKTIYYSISDANADIYASNISVTNEGTYFDIHWQGRVIENVYCSLIGRPNIYNCLVAFAIGSINGADDELLVRSIEKVNITYSLRQNHMKVGAYNLFIDCFNASLESIEHDMNTMENLLPDEGGRKVVVIGDVAELGEKAEEIHKKIGISISRHKIDKYFCYGKYSDCVYEGVIENNPKAFITAYKDREALENDLKEYMKPGDLILWKASRDTHIELLIDNIFGTDFYPLYPNDYDNESKIHIYPEDALLEKKSVQRYYRMGEPVGGLLYHKTNVGEFEYCIYDNGIKYVRHNSIGKNIVVPQQIDEVKVRSIGDRAFYKGKISSVDIPDSVVNIATNAFLRCYNLKNVKLNKGVKFIDYSAFAYCTALEEIEIPENCFLIRKKAFSYCKRLKTVIIKGMNTYLEQGTFEESNNIVINCKEGSLAQKFASENGIRYIIINTKESERNLIVPEPIEKQIIIEDFDWVDNGVKSRLNVSITLNNGRKDVLWYEVDTKWKKYMCDDRIDAIVVSLLLFLVRGKYTKIKSKYPISSKLKYQLVSHLLPQLVDFEELGSEPILQFEVPTTKEKYSKEFVANGTGFSRGVDSFATLYEYGKNSSASDDFKVNFLNLYNVGAFHGMNEGKRSNRLSRELYIEQAEDMVEFANKYGYTPLIVDSNLSLFIRTHFNSQEYGLLRKFQNSATERNIGTTLLFQKLFDRFYYASGHTLKEFKLDLDQSSALWEQYAVQFFSTENIDFYISNRDWSRMEKIEKISHLPEAYDNLQVCLVRSENCGICMKCKRTLMNLDVLGDDVLEKFSKSFDLVKYKNENRKDFFDSLWVDKESDSYAMDILKTAIENESDLIKNPPITGDSEKYTYRYTKSRFSILSSPTYKSNEICLITNDIDDPDFKIEGVHRRNWVKVKLFDGRVGYVNSKNIRISKFKPATDMKLNIGKKLILNVGNRYGVLPVFSPRNGNEQVKYSITNTNIAYVNKMGWVYAVAPGKTILTASTESGLVAECEITVNEFVGQMRLNAGKHLTLYIGKKYGFLPIFDPIEKTEPITYSVSDDSIVIVNKLGWAYAIAEGMTVLRAVSKSGVTAECTITVKKHIIQNKRCRKLKKFIKRLLSKYHLNTKTN